MECEGSGVSLEREAPDPDAESDGVGDRRERGVDLATEDGDNGDDDGGDEGDEQAVLNGGRALLLVTLGQHEQLEGNELLEQHVIPLVMLKSMEFSGPGGPGKKKSART